MGFLSAALMVRKGVKMSNRDTEQVIMEVQKATLLMDPFFKLTAVGTVMLITFLARMVKEHKIKKGDFKNFQEFVKTTEGKYSIVNVPITEKMQDVDIVSSLEKMGICYDILPDLDFEDGVIQIAVYDDDKEKFTGWLERYLTQNMRGGEKELQELNNLTEGRVTIQSIPAEGMEETIEKDFEVLGINYSVLPDLQVGDGEIQIVVANSDVPKVEHWFGLYKDEQLSRGKEVKEMRTVDMSEYMNTGEMTEEQYVNTASPDIVKANQKYEGNAPGEIERSVMAQSRKIKSESDVAFEAYDKNSEYQKISIDKKSCIENSHFPESEKRRATENGLFYSRVPGTWYVGKTAPEQTLLLDQERVFEANDGKTYIAFIKKGETPLVAGGDGKIIGITHRKTGKELFKQHYDPVEWEVRSKRQIVHNNPTETMEQIRQKAPEKLPTIPNKIK